MKDIERKAPAQLVPKPTVFLVSPEQEEIWRRSSHRVRRQANERESRGHGIAADEKLGEHCQLIVVRFEVSTKISTPVRWRERTRKAIPEVIAPKFPRRIGKRRIKNQSKAVQ